MLSLPRDNFRSPSALAAFFLTVILGLTLDLWSKSYSFDHLAVYRGTRVVDSQIDPFIPGWLEFTVTTNKGAVFGFGAGWRFFFIFGFIPGTLFFVYLFAPSGRPRLYQG